MARVNYYIMSILVKRLTEPANGDLFDRNVEPQYQNECHVTASKQISTYAFR